MRELHIVRGRPGHTSQRGISAGPPLGSFLIWAPSLIRAPWGPLSNYYICAKAPMGPPGQDAPGYSIRCAQNTKRRWLLKQAKRSRRRTGAGYESGAYSNIKTAPKNMDDECAKCKVCGGSEDTGILTKTGSSSLVNVNTHWSGCLVVYARVGIIICV